MNLSLERKQNLLKEINTSSYIPDKVTLEIGNDNKVEVWWEDKIGFNNFIGQVDFSELIIFDDVEIYKYLSDLVENFNKKKNLEEMIVKIENEIEYVYKDDIEKMKIYLEEYLDLLKKM